VVAVRKKTVGRNTYYYLEHTFRVGSSVQKAEQYLGRRIPDNIEALKAKFLSNVYGRRFYPLLEEIKANYSRESSSMPKSMFEKQARIFSIKFTYDTNRIEGSKLTYKETADLLERGITPRYKPLNDVKEAEAHEKVFREMLDYRKDLSLQLILSWHEKLFRETKPDIAGNVRQHQVGISGSKFMPPPPVEIYSLLKEFISWYDKNKKSLNPVEQAALTHLKLVTIHPFGDGNGRISRLTMNFVLHRNGYPMLNIPYTGRTSYYNALERAQVKEQEHIFTHWFIKKYLKEHKRYLTK
jgi:Fic family protein